MSVAHTVLYSTINTVGRSVASIYDLGSIFTLVLHALINIYCLASCISAIDLPTVVYVLHTIGECATDEHLPENASHNDTTLPKSLYC